ncbi:MAG: hypothetical protein AAGM22_29720, partial [Acidobacteriota bacterium]
ACALSPNPSRWFAALFLRKGAELEGVDSGTIAAFLSRVAIEHPSFTVSEEFGFGVLRALSMIGTKDVALISKFLWSKPVIRSLNASLDSFLISSKRKYRPCRLRIKPGREVEHGELLYPTAIRLSSRLVTEFAKLGFVEETAPTGERVFSVIEV